MKYVWVRPNSTEDPIVFVDDPVELFRGNKFDENVDKLYQLGPEVRLKVTMEPVKVHRGNDGPTELMGR